MLPPEFKKKQELFSELNEIERNAAPGISLHVMFSRHIPGVEMGRITRNVFLGISPAYITRNVSLAALHVMVCQGSPALAYATFRRITRNGAENITRNCDLCSFSKLHVMFPALHVMGPHYM